MFYWTAAHLLMIVWSKQFGLVTPYYRKVSIRVEQGVRKVKGVDEIKSLSELGAE